MRSSRWRHRAAPLAVFATALFLLTINLGHPDRIMFDETYYVNDARDFLEQGVEDGFVVHPPLGKLIIASGIWMFGDDAFGWRVMGAVAGAATVLLAFLIARRLFRRDGPAYLAAFLLATDGLFFVQARTSMLDVYLAFFVALGAWLLLVDHDRTTARENDPRDQRLLELGTRQIRTRSTLPRRSRWVRHLAGVAFGLAIATKWSGLLPLGAAGLLSIGWELAYRWRLTGSALRQWSRGVGSLAIGLVMLPAAAYLVTWTPWYLNFEVSYEGKQVCGDRTDCDVGFDGRTEALWDFHGRIWRFHENLDVEHGYRAHAYTWPVMARPIVYYWESCSEARASGIPRTEDDGKVVEPEPCVVERTEAAEILAVGNPALWYPFIAAAGLLVAGMVRRDRRAWFIGIFWAAQYLPWLFQSRPLFFFYAVPNVLFLALGLGYAVTLLDERVRLRGTVAGAIVGAGAGYAVGLLAEGSVSTATPVWHWVALAIGYLFGAGVGAAVDIRGEKSAGAPLVRRRGTWVGAVVAVIATVMFGFFAPVWTGVTMDRDQVELRWWQPGWI